MLSVKEKAVLNSAFGFEKPSWMCIFVAELSGRNRGEYIRFIGESSQLLAQYSCYDTHCLRLHRLCGFGVDYISLEHDASQLLYGILNNTSCSKGLYTYVLKR